MMTTQVQMTTSIREVIAYLRSLKSHQFADKNEQESVSSALEKMGLTYVSQGVFSKVYRLGNFVVKIGSDNFNPLRKLRHNPLFKKCAPTVYWVHQCGKAMVCKFVQFVRTKVLNTHYRMRRAMEQAMSENGINPVDLHVGNLGRHKVGRRLVVVVVDYGCWMH